VESLAQLKRKSAELAELRYYLLPWLMSGKCACGKDFIRRAKLFEQPIYFVRYNPS